MKTILMSLIAVLYSLTAFAGHDHHEALMCSNVGKEDFMKKMARGQDKFLKKFKLNANQEKAVEASRNNSAERIYAQVGKVRAAHGELMAALDKDAPADELRAKFMNVEKEKQALMGEKLEQMLVVRETLTPDQRQKIVATLKKDMADDCD